MKMLATIGVAALLAGMRAAASDIEVAARVHPDRVYSNQHFRIVLSIRTRNVRLGGRIRMAGLFEDRRMIQISDFQELAPERRMDGLAVLETRRFSTLARAEGKGQIELKPTVHVNVMERRRTGFGPRWTETPVTVAARPLRVTVLPLPPDAPASFSGAVGQFRFEAEPSATEAAVGDLIALRVRIDGEGCLDGIHWPQATGSPDLSVYEPALVSDSPSRSLVYEQTLVPRSENVRAIPALTFCYFDPVREKYVTETRGPFPLTFREPVSSEREETFRPEALPEQAEPSAPDRTARAGKDMAKRWQHWTNRLRGRETAMAARAVYARLAPAPGALATFRIPADAEVTTLERHGDWAKVQYRDNRGWIPAEALNPAATP